MLELTTEAVLDDALLRIAGDPDLRQRVYEHLREYCHQCRNRLNSLKLSIYLAMRQSPSTAELWLDIERHYRDLEMRVEQIQLLCRPMTLSRVTLGIDLLVEDRRQNWSRVMASEGKALELVAPTTRAIASFDVDRMGKVLDAIVAWRAAARSAARSAKLRWWVEKGFAHISWEEPMASKRDRAVPESEDSPSWSLAMLARVAGEHGGDYRIETDRGWRLEVSWPSQLITP